MKPRRAIPKEVKSKSLSIKELIATIHTWLNQPLETYNPRNVSWVDVLAFLFLVAIFTLIGLLIIYLINILG